MAERCGQWFVRAVDDGNTVLGALQAAAWARAKVTLDLGKSPE